MEKYKNTKTDVVKKKHKEMILYNYKVYKNQVNV